MTEVKQAPEEARDKASPPYDERSKRRVAEGTDYVSGYDRKHFDKSWILEWVLDAAGLMILILLGVLAVKIFDIPLNFQKNPDTDRQDSSVSEKAFFTESEEAAAFVVKSFFEGEIQSAAKHCASLDEGFWYYYGQEESYADFEGYMDKMQADYDEMELSRAKELQYFFIESRQMNVELIKSLGLSEAGVNLTAAVTCHYQCVYALDGEQMGYDVYIYCYEIDGKWYGLW